jgi:magnesium and cobalt transporter
MNEQNPRRPLRNPTEAAPARDRPATTDRPQRRPFLNWVRNLGRPKNGEQLRDTIEELIEVGARDSDTPINPDEGQLIRNILHLNELTAADVMVPRGDIIAIEAGASLQGLIKLLAKETHSRLPVYRGTLDDIIGMVHIKDVLPFWNSRKDFKLETVKREVLFAAPSMKVLDLLTEMRSTRIHLALVIDEYGGIDGLVTIEDLVEEIVGEIEDEHDDPDEFEFTEIRSGVAVADARLRIEDFEGVYGEILSEEEREYVDTLGGLVFYLASRVPSRGELIRHESGIEFEILEADPRRIHRLRLRNLPARLAVDEAAE